MRNVIDEIKELELLFSSNDYDGIGKYPFEIIPGNNSVIISAPHAINQYRDGQVKWADMFTGGIAKYIHKITGCHVIYSCKYDEHDPNYDLPGSNPYQDTLADYVKSNDIVFLIDLHGAAKKREYALEMGTAPEQNPIEGVIYETDPSLHEYKYVAEWIKEIFENMFINSSFEQKEVWKNRIFDAGDQNTVTKFISENTNTACVQLEVNGHYRNPENETEFLMLVNGLVELVNRLKNIIN